MANALYNKYRPQVFEEVVGQEHIARTLKNAIASDKTSHSYLFTGPRGTGKTTMARLFSKALQCESGPTPNPDGSCEDCELIARGEHPDVYELDAASRTGVENVREEIIGKVRYAPVRGRNKVYIIDEVHMLSTAAFNALLKTLEEPPEHVVFILCTTDPQKVPETILSRCQRFDFRRIPSEEMIARLGAICEMEGVDFEGDALDLIAHRADGGMRDALTSLDQVMAFGDGRVDLRSAERLLGSLDSSDLAEIVDAIGKRDAARCFRWTAEYMETGVDLVQFVQELTSHMRDMYVMSLSGADIPLEITEAARRELEEELPMYGPDRLARALDVLNSLGMELRTSTNQRLSFEVALTRLVRAQSDLTLDALAERIEQLERNSVQSSSPLPDSLPIPAMRQPRPQSQKPPDEPRIQVEQNTRRASEQIDAASAADTSQEASAPELKASPHAPKDMSSFWETVQGNLKRIGAPYAVIFMGTAVHMEGDMLVIEFEHGKDFAFKASQKQESKAALAEALEKSGMPGARYRIEMRPEGSPSDPMDHRQKPYMAEPDTAKPDASESDASESDMTVIDAKKSIESEKPDKALYDAGPEDEMAEATSPDESAEEASADADFSDFLASAFGEGLVIEEVSD